MTERIVLGSGKMYIKEFTGTLPENESIEADANLLGLIQGGASLEYKPSFYEAKDDLGLVSKKIITDEEATLKSGIMTWNLNTLAKLCNTGRVIEGTGIRTLKIGGLGNFDGKQYVIHFLHEDEMDGDLRVTVVGSNEAGFSLAFAKDKETVIDAEFKAQPADEDGTLIILQEEIVPDTAPADTRLAALIIGTKGLTPPFNPKAYAYTLETEEEKEIITAIPADGEAIVEVKLGENTHTNGTEATWAAGANAVKITVSKGTATRVYTVTVTKS